MAGKTTRKRILSLVLTAAMLIGFVPAGLLTTAYAEESSAGTSVNRDTFGIAMKGELTEEETALYRANNPYGTEEWFPLFTVSELYYAEGHSGGRYIRTRDYDNTTVTNVRGSGTLIGQKDEGNGGGFNMMDTAPIDLNGTGSKGYVATVAYWQGGNALELFVTDKDGNRVTNTYNLATGEHIEYLDDVAAYYTTGYVSVAAGDFDGDGVDTIIAYIPRMRGETPTIAEYKVVNGTITWVRDVLNANLYELLGNVDLSNEREKKSRVKQNVPHAQILAEDVDNDNIDEVIITAGLHDVYDDGDSNGNVGSKLFIYDLLDPNGTLEDTETKFHKSYEVALNKNGNDKTPKDSGRFRWASSTVGNVSSTGGGTDFPEIISAGIIDDDSDDAFDVSGETIGLFQVSCNSCTITGGTTVGTYAYRLSTSVNTKEFVYGGYYSGDQIQALVPVQAFSAWGVSHADALFAGGVVYKQENSEFKEVHHAGYFDDDDDGIGGSIISNGMIIDVTAANFDGNDEGREQLIFATLQKRKAISDYFTRMFTYTCDAGDVSDSSSGWNNYRDDWLTYKENHAYISLCAPDIDNSDSTIVKLKSVERTYTEPEVLAILEATPYFEELPDTRSNSETVYGKSETTGTGTGSSNTLSTNVVAGFEWSVDDMLLTAGFACGAGFEATIENNFTWSTSEEIYETYELSYSNDSKDNAVIVYRRPVIAYEYEVRGSDQTLVLAKEGELSTSMITVDEYNAAAAQYGLDPIPKNILAEPGDPFSYRSNTNGLDNVVTKDNNTTQYNGTGTVTQSFTNGTSTTDDFTYELNTSFTAYGLIFGAKVGGGAGYAHTTSTSTINSSEITKAGTVSGISSDKYDGYDFQWQFAHWNTEINGTTIPVLGYILKDVMAPPSPPQNLVVDNITTTGAEISWEHGSRPADEYRIYQYFAASDKYILVATVDGTETACTISNLLPDNTYTFVVRGYSAPNGADMNSGESIDSEALSFATAPEGAAPIVIDGAQDVSAKVGGTATFSVDVTLPGDRYSSVNYQWQSRKQGTNWTDIRRAEGAVLTLEDVTEDMSGTSYRCEIGAVYSGSLITYYSDSGKLTVGKASTEAELTVTGHSGGSGTVAEPYTGQSDYMKANGTDAITITTNENKTIAHNGIDLIVYGTASTTGEGANAVMTIGAPYYGYDSANDVYYALTEAGGSYTVDGKIVEVTGYKYTDINGAAATVPAIFNSNLQITNSDATYYLFADVTGSTKDTDETDALVDTRLDSMTGVTYYWVLDGKCYIYGEDGAVGEEIAGLSPDGMYEVYVKKAAETGENGTVIPAVLVLGRGETYTVNEGTESTPEYEDVEESWYYSISQTTSETSVSYAVTAFTSEPVSTYHLGSAEGNEVTFSTSKLTPVTVSKISTVEVPKYSAAAGATLTLSASVTETNGPAIKDASVAFRVTNTVTGAVEEIKATTGDDGKATATWRAPACALYSIVVTVGASTNYLGTVSNAKYYDALGTAEDQSSTEYEYRLLLTKGDETLTGSMPYGGTFNYKLQRRAVGTSGWSDYVPSDNEILTYSVTTPNKTESIATGESHTYTPVSAGLYAVKVYRGTEIDAAKMIASASLNVTRLSITVTPTWTATPTSADDVTLESSYAAHTDAYLKSIFNINCEYFGNTSASGVFAVTLSYKTGSAVNTFKNNFQATLESDNFTIKPNSAPVYFSSAENGSIVGRAGENLFLMASGSSQASGTKLTFNAEPNEGYAVDKWIINGTEYAADSAALPDWFICSGNTLTIERFNASAGSDHLKDSKLTVEVTFISSSNVVAYSVNGNVGGTVSAVVDDGSNTAFVSGTSVAKGADIVITAVPADGYVVDHWTVNDKNYTWDDGPIFCGTTLTLEDIAENYTVVVHFAESSATYSITTSVYSEAGAPAAELATISAKNAETGETIRALNGLKKNTSVTFTATLNETNNTVKEWQTSTDGITFTTVSGSGGQNSFTLYNLDANTYVRAIVTNAQSYALNYSVLLDGEEVTNESIAKLRAVSNSASLASGGSYGAYISIDFALTINDNYYVVAWSGNVTPDASAKNANIPSLNAPTEVTVTIAEKPVITFTGDDHITVIAKQGETVLASGDHVEMNSGSITFTATPNTGYETDKWTLGGVIVTPGSNAAASDITAYTAKGPITSDIAVQVTAKKIPQYSITLATEEIDEGGAHGTISASVARKALDAYADDLASGDTFYRDSDITITAAPEAGYRIKTYTWTINGTSGSGITIPEDLLKNVQGDVSITARFVKTGSGITFDPVDAESTGGYISAASAANMDVLANANGLTLEEGVSLKLTATAKTGYEVEGWYTNGTLVEGSEGMSEYTYTSNGNDETAITVQFRQVLYTINAEMEHGTIDVATLTDGKARGGESLTFTAAPDSGYEVIDWTVNGVSKGISGNTFTWTVENGMAANKAVDSFTVKAVLDRGSYTVTYTDTTGGKLASETENGSYVTSGASVTITATADTGYSFKGWKVNGQAHEETSATLILTVTADTTVEAVFEADTYTVTFNATGEAGTIKATADGKSVNSGDAVSHNAKLVFTVTPSGTNMVSKWTIDGTTPTGYAMTDTADAALTYTTTVTGNVTVSVEIVACPTYTVTVTAGENGSVSAETIPVPRNGSATITATPNDYYQFDSWTVDGVLDTASGTTLTISSIKKNMEVSASFKEAIRYDVTFSVICETGNASTAAAAADGVAIYPTATEPVRIVGNSTLVFTAAPAMNGENNADMVASWSVNGVVQDNLSNVLTIDKLTEKTDVVLTFAEYEGYTIPTSSSGYTISDVVRTPADTAPVSEIRKNGTLSFKITPAAGSYLTTLTVNDVNCLTTAESGNVAVVNNGDGSFLVTITNVAGITFSAESKQYQVVKNALTEVPAILAQKYPTLADLESALRTAVTKVSSNYKDAVLFDIVLQYTTDGGLTWQDATAEHFPAGGVKVSIDYADIAEGVDNTHTYTVIHMFTSDMNGHIVGDTEVITPTKTETGIEFTVTSLSPFAIGYFKTTASGGGGGSGSGGGGGDFAPATNEIIVETPTNGTIITEPEEEASAGEDVVIKATPDEGYKIGSVIVTDEGSKKIEVTEQEDGTYVFEMPSETVTVKVNFIIDFVDVAEDNYYSDAVDWAVENGITTGVTAAVFSPTGVCTRAQAVTFLWRAAGCPEPENGEMAFTDVPENAYYYDAVLWAIEQGITNGTSETTFSPNMTCSRAHIVTFLWRAQGKPLAETEENPFTDVGLDVYYGSAVLWAVENGITTGTTETTFSPNDYCTRAQIVTFLWRCFN